MRPEETLIEMARRHVAEAEGHVEKQRRLVARLAGDGLPTEMAVELLREFEDSLEDHRRSLSRIQDEQRSGRRDPFGNLLPRDG